ALEAAADPAADLDDDVVYVDPFEDDPPADFLADDDGDILPEEVRAELEALASEEFDDSSARHLEAALAEAQQDLARQRSLTQQAVARYRDALLAAEPELPPDLVHGDTPEDVDATA